MARASAPATRHDDTAGDEAAREPRKPLRRTLPEKIEHLFVTIQPPGQYREYTHEEIAERAKAAGHSISASFVNALRRHPDKTPSVEKLEALAAGFGISVAYFFDDETAAVLEEKLGLIVALGRPEVRKVALAAADLDPENLLAIFRIINQAREWQGLGAWEDEQNEA